MITQHKWQIFAWGLYDWANSAFSTLILTFVFATYFTNSVMTDSVKAASLWSVAIGISGMLLLLLSPIMGAVSDRTPRLKIWIAALIITMIIGLLMMDAEPTASMDIIYRVLAGLIIANLGFELGIVMVNSYLPQIARADEQGRVSSLAWGLGYVGGIVAMILALFGFIGLGDIKPWFELSRETAAHIRAILPITAIWMALFSIPLFLWMPKIKNKITRTQTVRDAVILPFINAWDSAKHDRNWRQFLIGSALYRDGLSTLFAVGGIYAAAKYGMKTQDILVFAIGMNITGGIGCFIAAYFERRIKPMVLIRLSLYGLIIIGACVLLAPTAPLFMAAAMILGFFVGPVQSASRTMVSHLSSPEIIGERYGIYALSGRAVSFIGPFLFAGLTHIFQSQTIGLSSVLILWVIGYIVIHNVKDKT